MSSAQITKWTFCKLLCEGVLCLIAALPLLAQVQTNTTTTKGASTKTVTVERGEITYVNGRNVVVKMEDGTLRHFNNVPESTTFLVDGKPVNINDAKVGMKLEKQTITTTTPQTITTVETVTGKVWHVSPPGSVILTLENGENQEFKIPSGQKFMVNGVETDAWGLRKGMQISAQRVTETPVTVGTQEVVRTGTAPELKPDVPILVVAAAPKPPVETAQVTSAPPAPASATSAPAAKLPSTASHVPLLGALGALFCALAVGLGAIRMARSSWDEWQD